MLTKLIIGDKQILIIFITKDNFLITNYQNIIIIEHCIFKLYYGVIIILYDYWLPVFCPNELFPENPKTQNLFPRV